MKGLAIYEGGVKCLYSIMEDICDLCSLRLVQRFSIINTHLNAQQRDGTQWRCHLVDSVLTPSILKMAVDTPVTGCKPFWPINCQLSLPRWEPFFGFNWFAKMAHIWTVLCYKGNRWRGVQCKACRKRHVGDPLSRHLHVFGSLKLSKLSPSVSLWKSHCIGIID